MSTVSGRDGVILGVAIEAVEDFVSSRIDRNGGSGGVSAKLVGQMQKRREISRAGFYAGG